MDKDDRMGLIHPSVDVHTLGLQAVREIIEQCGVACVMAPQEVCDVAGRVQDPSCARTLADWIRGERLTAIGFSYRLDPADGAAVFSAFMDALSRTGMSTGAGGRVRLVYFAGLPKTCDQVSERFPSIAGLFRGDESPMETAAILGLPSHLLPRETIEGNAYDLGRLSFGRGIVRAGEYAGLQPVDRGHYRSFGKRGDSVVSRIAEANVRNQSPLMRAHVGPFLADRRESVALFLDWTRRLAAEGMLDVLSIGTSQLSQSEFGRSWEGLADGGGVPLSSPEEFAAVWEAARPMLVRCYAGTRDVPAMARMLEDTIDNAWHALSLWWFSALDGRGPNTVLENLRQHMDTLRFVASVDKPFEPNVPHHFAFRGADDLTYVLSGLVAAKVAKRSGVQRLILQVMLNTPKATSGIMDLAKARALLHLVRELEDGDFRVYLQTRGGLDYFSHEEESAKIQLAAVTALMDDIEPSDPASPQIIHVVSYSEGFELASPSVVNESIRITRMAREEYRRARDEGRVADMSSSPAVIARTSELIKETRKALAAIESTIIDPYSAEGLYEILAAGFFAMPGLVGCRDEFPTATAWRTKLVRGAVRTVDARGLPISFEERLAVPTEIARKRARDRVVGRAGS